MHKIKNIITIFGLKFLILLFINQLILKGLLYYGIFNNLIFPLFSYLGISTSTIQIYSTFMYLPWTLKPITGLIVDTTIILFYKKIFWQWFSCLIGICSTLIFFTNNYNIILLIFSFVLLNSFIAILDLICESKYSEIMRLNPESGSSIIMYNSLCQQIGAFMGMIIIGPLMDNNNYFVIFLIIGISTFISIYPNVANWINENKNNEIFGLNEIIFRNKGLIILPIYLGLCSLAYFWISYCPYLILQLCFFVVMFLLFIALTYFYLDKTIANVITYIILVNVLWLNFDYQLQYFYTNSDVINGYDLNYTFYVTICNLVFFVSSITATIVYQKMWGNITFRKKLLVIQILNVLPFTVDIILLTFTSTFINYIYVVKLLLILKQIIKCTTAFYSISLTTLYSKLCDKKIETIMISLFAGVFNLSIMFSTWLSDQYYNVYLQYIGNEQTFKNFNLIIILLGIILPIITVIY